MYKAKTMNNILHKLTIDHDIYSNKSYLKDDKYTVAYWDWNTDNGEVVDFIDLEDDVVLSYLYANAYDQANREVEPRELIDIYGNNY